MMTEAKAKLKWCPHFTASHTDPRGTYDDRFAHACIGSQCMAWRWNLPGRGDVVTYYERPDSGATGYCGLSGKP